THIAKLAFTPPAFSTETSRLIFPFSSQRNSNWLSISRPPRRSAWTCRQRCWPAARNDGQWLLLPVKNLPNRLQTPRPSSNLHQALYSEDQWKGRTLHSNSTA